ncbi:MAG: HDOD domain-containing protein [Firmicutes bacterium]|nr:HDOD domain-containing protein [Bacillota bacterium]
MKKVLFVDDEPNVIQGLRRLMRSMPDDWDPLFAGGGEEALSILSSNQVDVIITDIRMPGMDGAELLNKVREFYPNIIRIALSGHSDLQGILKSVKAAHQYLAKPCEPETLRNTVERTLLLRELVENEKIVKLVTGVESLPSLPDIYIKLLEELRAPEPSLKRLGEIISHDITMTAKILHFVNSAFFGMPKRITNLSQAITLLGMNTIKALVLCNHIFMTIKPQSKKNLFIRELWEHSMIVASVAKEIMAGALHDSNLADEAFITGLLHDIGKLLFLNIPGHFDQMKALTEEQRCDQTEAEYKLLGVSHAEVGAYILGLWGFSDPIIESVVFHHSPLKSKNNRFSILTAVHVANAFVLENSGSSETTYNLFIDYSYLEQLDVKQTLPLWAGVYRKLRDSTVLDIDIFNA